MKTLIVGLLLLIPSMAMADKYEDMDTGLREVLIALSQMNIQGSSAAVMGQVQQALTKMRRDVAEAGKENQELTLKSTQCEKREQEKVANQSKP